MKHASLRHAPVSIHLERRREFLEHRGKEPAGADEAIHPSELSPLDGHTEHGEALPFERPDDED